MSSYLVRRLVALVPLLIGISLAVFLAVNILPGNVVRSRLGVEASRETEEQLMRELGLDRPVLVRYGEWVLGAIHGDFGRSFLTGVPVAEELKSRLAVTAQLAFVSVMVSLGFAIPSGVASAVRQNSLADFLLRIVTSVGISLPGFVVGMLLLLVVSREFRWAPPLGFTHLWDDPVRSLQILALPSIALGARLAAAVSRMTRSSMLEVLRQDYVQTARAKGLPPWRVVYGHALRNALIPVLTVIGVQTGYLLGGAVVIEELFSLPGLGRLLLSAIYTRDYPVVMGCVTVIASMFAVINLVADLAYAVIDPRIRYS